MSAITTHVLDTSRGRPAGGVLVVLEVTTSDGQQESAAATPTPTAGCAPCSPPTRPSSAGRTG